jgi:hypothetical protein
VAAAALLGVAERAEPFGDHMVDGLQLDAADKKDYNCN